MIKTHRPVPLATFLYLAMWFPAVLLASFISFIGYIGAGFGLGSPFLLTLPMTLIGIWSVYC